MSYLFRYLFLRTAIAMPVPDQLNRLLRSFVDTKAGENFGDMRINGEFHFLRSHAPACSMLFDVGAHEGIWTQFALRANPQANIHCFEPLRANYDRLVAQGFPSQVVCNNLGCSDTAARKQMFTKAWSLYGTMEPGVAGDGSLEDVELTTIDSYCRSNGITVIDLLKIDTEGHDLAVIRGAEQMIRAGSIRRIQFEYGPRNIFSRVFLRDFFHFFRDLPYTIYQLMPSRLMKIPMYSRRFENMQYKNFVALHVSVPQ